MVEVSSSAPAVFLSYCHADPNADVVRLVYSALSSRYRTFCDVELEPGVRWAAEIDANLASASYFVVFLSAEAADSKGVTEEVRRAVTLNPERGRPRIIPVRLAYDGDLKYELGMLLNSFQFEFWQTSDDTQDLIAKLDSVITGKRSASVGDAALFTSRYQVPTARQKRVLDAFVPPPGVKTARDLLRSAKVLWITGPDGAGKHFLATALACELGQSVFEYRPVLSWRQIFNSRPTNSVLLLPNALAPERAGSYDYEMGLAVLRQLCDTDNSVLLTCTDDAYGSRNADLTDVGFETRTLTRYRLGLDAYSRGSRVEVVRKLLRENHSREIISGTQRRWVEDCLSQEDGQSRRATWQNWKLSDIESFVNRLLPAAQTSSDVEQLLDHHRSLEEQVHAWFLSLDEIARCFLLTLLLHPEASSEQIWNRFREIVAELERLALVPRLSLPSLGVCRNRCAPYVTTTDYLEITDEEMASTIRRELAVNWREYVLELRHLLVRWALPPERERNQARSDDDPNRATRQELSHLIGHLMSVRVEDVLPFLDEFSVSEDRRARRSAADAVTYAFESEGGIRNCRKLLGAWEKDRSGETNAVRKRRVTANACWRIAERYSGPELDFAIEQLQLLTRDVPLVRSEVAFGLSRVVRRQRTNGVLSLLERLSNDPDEIVRRRTAIATAELTRRDPRMANEMIARWSGSGESRRIWTVAYALIAAPRFTRQERDRLTRLMQTAPSDFVAALASALRPADDVRDKENIDDGRRKLLWLTEHEDSNVIAAEAVALFWAKHPQRGASLCERLHDIDSASFAPLLARAYERRIMLLQADESHDRVVADMARGGACADSATNAIRAIIDAWIANTIQWPAASILLRTAAYSLIVSPRTHEADKERLRRIIDGAPHEFAEAFASAVTMAYDSPPEVTLFPPLRTLRWLNERPDDASAWAIAVGSYWASFPDRGRQLCDRITAIMPEDFGNVLAAACYVRLTELVPIDFLDNVLTDLSSNTARRAVVTTAVEWLLAEWRRTETSPFFDISLAVVWQNAPARVEQFLAWLRMFGENGANVNVRIRAAILEGLSAPNEVVDCAAGWLNDREIAPEVTGAIHQLLAMPQGHTTFGSWLVPVYWSAIDKVWSILNAGDLTLGRVVRMVVYDDVITKDRGRFVMYILEELKRADRASKVLDPLNIVAGSRHKDVVRCIRHSVAALPPQKILKLLNDFSVYGQTLRRISKQLWFTRLRLSIVEAFSNS